MGLFYLLVFTLLCLRLMVTLVVVYVCDVCGLVLPSLLLGFA